MEIGKLSIIMPVYNEEKTILLILNKIKSVEISEGIEKEIIIVNDHSVDGTDGLIRDYMAENPQLDLKYFWHNRNKGKGAAIQTGMKHASGDLLIVQDADVEYDPRDYNSLIEPILAGFADVVYGSRFMGGNPHRILFFWHSIGNRILTFLSNMFTNLNLTDMETCYKMFKTSIFQDIKLREQRFGFEPEVTAKISRIPNIRIYEVGISYYGRSYNDGKKINWKDGIWAILCIVKYGLFKIK